jgi:alpha-L-arabinofuranosidase
MGKALAVFTVFLVTLCNAKESGRLSGVITIDTSRPGIRVSPLLYGAFFEEINRAGEGGVYAEMLQNRSFEDCKEFPAAWVPLGGVSLSLDRSNPLNARNPTSLRVHAAEAGDGVANFGFAGTLQGDSPQNVSRDWQNHLEKQSPQISVRAGRVYGLTFFGRVVDKQEFPLEATLEDAEGHQLCKAAVRMDGGDWRMHEVSLRPERDCDSARLAFRASGRADFCLDMVSLFPKDTWKMRKNGLRPDLMEYVAAMKPAFMRFPGGCFVEGRGRENRAQWKNTIGPVEARRGQWGIWQYYPSNGLGFHEFLQMCEDLSAEPLFVINCGMGHDFGEKKWFIVPVNELGPFIQDALDAIEYANGSAESTWGALRVKNGHPAPFNLKYLEIGNENGSCQDYTERFRLFQNSILAKYPDIHLIADEEPRIACEFEDKHRYASPEIFFRNATQFDSYDRKGPKIYFGEYAVVEDCGNGNLLAAVSEAAFLTGLERNSDIVLMSSYAPLFCRAGWQAWKPNAIYFNQRNSYGTPSYWVQRMFSLNRPDRILPLSLQLGTPLPEPLSGKIGLGSWLTACEYRDIKVTANDGRLLFSLARPADLTGWTAGNGDWSVADGCIRQNDAGLTGTRIMAGNSSWCDCTLTLRARKVSGQEGFLIYFASNAGNVYWNIGGWGNQFSAIEGEGFNAWKRVPCTIEAGRWYDIRIELQGRIVRCFLDGKLVLCQTQSPVPWCAAVAGTVESTREIILKVANGARHPVSPRITLEGPAGAYVGKVISLTGNPNDENSFRDPNHVIPAERPFRSPEASFSYDFPACSVTIFRLKQE